MEETMILFKQPCAGKLTLRRKRIIEADALPWKTDAWEARVPKGVIEADALALEN